MHVSIACAISSGVLALYICIVAANGDATTLDNLPDTLRLPVVLYYLDGLTVAETAQTLGVPVGTVKFRLHQARKKLRVELDAPEGEGANVQ